MSDYNNFRTGLTFAAVSQELHVEANQRFDATGERMFVTRHTVLGRWHEIKQRMYEHWRRYEQV